MSDLYLETAQTISIYVLLVSSVTYLVSRLKTTRPLQNACVCCMVSGLALFAVYILVLPAKTAMFVPSILFSWTVLGVCIAKDATICKNRRASLWFLSYVGIILLITLVLRIGWKMEKIQLDPIAGVKAFIETGNILSAEHAILNIVLFVPLGFLFYLLKNNAKGRLDNQAQRLYLSEGLFLASCLSSTIESTQLMFSIGEWDSGDMMNNVLGMVAGTFTAFAVKKRN